jgi:murein DD-endopeptidase MepM/ murein hydrolase activator NlpD
MGQHRADPRASRGRETVTHSTPPDPVSRPGKRAARRGDRAEVPVTRPASEPVRRTAGGRRAAPRKALFRGLPSAPILLGVAALAVSAGGALTAGDPQLVGADGRASPAKIMQASAVNGAGGVATTSLLGSRGPVVSRDSRRDAQADAAGADLVAEAEAQAKERDAALADFAAQAEKQAAKIKLNLWHLPVLSYHLTAQFGDYGLWSGYHTGLDFAAPSGTPIYAVANGIITSASYDGSYGNKTVQTLDDGTEIWYCHQTSYTVSSGETVRAGELIGYIGSTGHVTGPHLHLEVRPGGGDPVDPYTALLVHGIQP